MTVVNVDTGEILDRTAAERRAEVIAVRLDEIADNYAAVMPLIRESIVKRDDRALGYRSPGDYVRDRFGGALQRLGVDVRREVVRELTEAGMSTRAIAPVVGVSQPTVVSDRRRATDQGLSVAGSTTTGINGKTYARPEPPVYRAPPAPPSLTRTGKTDWSARVQAVSADCPIEDLTDDEVAELLGAATFLRDYCRGELSRRETP